MRLIVQLLGSPQVHLDGQPVTGLVSNKVRALLFLLAAEPDRRPDGHLRPHRRESLAGLLWPDYPERSARTNLSNALSHLRTALGDRDLDIPFLLVSGEAIQLNPQADCVVDVLALEEWVAQGAWQEAADTYTGSFLEGFSLPDSPPFESWTLNTRQRLQDLVLDALERATAQSEAEGDHSHTIETARRQLQIAPWHEGAHRSLIRAFALSGERAAALAQYESCVRALEQELHIAPDAQTQALYEQIRDGTLTAAPSAAPEVENPYKGLRPFAEADADDFFGRDRLVRELLLRLAGTGDPATGSAAAPTRFLAVVGPSGSGKSSAVKAGLIPALRQGQIRGSDRWLVATCTPGAHPYEELEAALLRVAVNPPPSLLEQLCQDERGLIRAARRALPEDPDAELLLVIDQFEELFTLLDDEETRARFLDSLVAAVQDPRSRTRIVLALRADFVGRALEYVALGDLVREHTAFVLPLAPNELEQAIVGPAERASLNVEPGLVERIVQDVGHQPGMLPLLQYALTELFERRQDHTLTLDAYRASGGVTGALTRRAEEVYEGLGPDGQEAARQFFLRLVTLGENVEDTRRRVPRAELETLSPSPQPSPQGGEGAALDQVIDAYGRYRLLTFDRDPLTRQPTVEMAHEALLREWPRLHDWLDESRGDVWMERLLGNATSEWLNAERDPSYLLRGARLAQFEGWAEGTPLALTADERAYLQASLADHEAREAEEVERQQRELLTARALADEQSRSASRLRRWSAILAVALLVALVAAVAAGLLGNQARLRSDENAQLAEANIDIAHTAQVASTRAVAGEVAAQTASTRAVIELENAQTAEAQEAAERAAAQTAQAQEAAQRATAEAETDLRATAEAVAVEQREDARRQASIGLASQAMIELEGYHPDRAVPLALEALENYPYTWQAERALGQAVLDNRLRMVLRHGNFEVQIARWSPDETRILTTSGDPTAKVWDARTGEELVTFTRHTNLVGLSTAASWSPDGDFVATGDQDGGAWVWDPATGEPLFELAGHTAMVNVTQWSPDGTRILTTSDDGTARIWDADTGEVLLMPETQGFGPVQCAMWSPSGERIVAAGWPNTVRVWDANSGETVYDLVGHTDAVEQAMWSPNGTRIATASWDMTARVWDATTGEELYTLSGHTGQIKRVTWSPDGTRIATTSDDGTARVWSFPPGGDEEQDVQVLTFAGHIVSVDAAAVWSPVGDHIATVGSPDNVKVWDATTGKEILTVFNQAGFAKVAWASDGARILTAGYDGTAQIWDLTSALLTLGPEGNTSRPAWSPTGNRVARGHPDGTTSILDTDTGEQLITLEGHEQPVWIVTWSPTGDRILTIALGGGERRGRVWDADTGEEMVALSGLTFVPFAASWSPNGTRIVTTDLYGNNTAQVWDAATGTELLGLVGHQASVVGTDWSPDGTKIATTGWDGTIKLWDAATGEMIMDLPAEGMLPQTTAVAWSPDGTRIAVQGWDGVGGVWDVDSGEKLAILIGRGTMWFIDWSPSGDRILGGGTSGAWVWDADSGAELLYYDLGGITQAAWSPDGTRIAIASEDGQLRIWSAWQTLEELIARAKACCLVRELTDAEREFFGLPVK